jgi:3-mercaptopyruvate sulfurtransferase SseA
LRLSFSLSLAKYLKDASESQHIPGAVNVTYLANIDPRLASATAAEHEQLLASGRPFTFASKEELAALYSASGVRPDPNVIAYCGRGYAAACGLLALNHDVRSCLKRTFIRWLCARRAN